jgi:hypothetical protein
MMKRTKCKKFVTNSGFDSHVEKCQVCGKRDLSDLEPPQRRMYYNRMLAEGKANYGGGNTNIMEVDSENEANLIASLTVNDTHAPVIDLDLPVRLLPSKTPGHFHLYLDVEMPKEDYFKLLQVMSEVGLVEEGYYKASVSQGSSYVRNQEMAIRDALGR